MPQNKQKTPLDRIVEGSGIKYFVKLIETTTKAVKERKEQEITYPITNEKDFAHSVYWFTRAINSLRDKPNCPIQSYYYLVSNPSSNEPESRHILSYQEYKKAKSTLDIKEKKGEIKVERITICDIHKICDKVTDPLEQKAIYLDKNFFCPFRSFASYQTEIHYYRGCNRPKIVQKMKEMGASDLEDYRKKIEFESKAVTLAEVVCRKGNKLELRRQLRKGNIPNQTIENIFKRAKEIIREKNLQ